MDSQAPVLNREQLISELQSFGVRLADPGVGAPSRRGGAGPSDHKAIVIDDHVVMAPVHTVSAFDSPYLAERPAADGVSTVLRDGRVVGRMSFPPQPKFYALQTLDGVPYSKIATLHGRDVLATTVLQTCIRYESRKNTCQFCAIGQSLAAGRTIARKTPEQLGEVARAAVLLDGVKHMVMTTGTPNATDRGARILCESAFGVKAAVDLPIQAQCEPPDDDAWFQRMKDAGVDALGMHLETISPEVRQAVMPGKAKVSVARYFEAFAAAVEVFGRGQVSTYVLAGLGDTPEVILETADRLIALGVYPFVVPFTPISGTPLESHPSPTPAFMQAILQPLAARLRAAGLVSGDIKAGCGRCGACSSLSAYGG
jgi:radical SAM protein (TIGR04043 family)